jgi:hypothetical protein
LEISFSNSDYRISLVEIDSLKPHEEVIDTIVNSLANSIRTQGIVRDPIVVDEDKHVILDGMHRYGALKLIECRWAPCCLVKYDNPLIKVGSWFRSFNIKDPQPLLDSLLNEGKRGYQERKADIDEALRDPRTVVFTQNGDCYYSQQLPDPIEAARNAVRLERALTIRDYHVDYVTESTAIQCLRSGNADLIIPLPVFTKQQIREFGTRGLLLPHKVTRHVLPSRPLRLDVPLNMLMGHQTSQSEAARELRELLSSRKTQGKPPGSVVDGRRYDEELLVFDS